MTRIERVTSPLPRECSTTELHGPNLSPLPSPCSGAGEGNRTLVISLEGFCSTIELHPPDRFTNLTRVLCPAGAPETGGGGWIRTNVGARPTDLQSAPFSRSGTPPAEPEIMWFFRWLVKNFRSHISLGTRLISGPPERCNRQARKSWGFLGRGRSPAPP